MLCQGLHPHPQANDMTVAAPTTEVKPLDDFVAGPVHAMKIDLKGAEVDVPSGMPRILAENPGLIALVESNPECLASAGVCPGHLPATLRELGLDSLSVLDPGYGRSRSDRPMSVAEVLRRLDDRALSEHWYGNIWAERDFSP